MDGRERPGLQERIEGSRGGRLALSALLAVGLTVIVVQTAQPSAVRAKVLDVTQPALFAVGLDQGWGVFAPDPRNMSLEFLARVHYEDGTTETWRMPEGGALVGDYWDYRWRKYLEFLVQEPFLQQTSRPFSEYVARQMHRDGRTPIKVVLVRRFRKVRPGESPPVSPVREQAYFTLPVTAEVLER